jgi:hypothetical protein
MSLRRWLRRSPEAIPRRWSCDDLVPLYHLYSCFFVHVSHQQYNVTDYRLYIFRVLPSPQKAMASPTLRLFKSTSLVVSTCSPRLPWKAPLVEMKLDLLPPLLQIPITQLSNKAHNRCSGTVNFTMDGAHPRVEFLQSPKDRFRNLELIGDSYIANQVTQILDEMYPEVAVDGKTVCEANGIHGHYLC